MSGFARGWADESAARSSRSASAMMSGILRPSSLDVTTGETPAAKGGGVSIGGEVEKLVTVSPVQVEPKSDIATSLSQEKSPLTNSEKGSGTGTASAWVVW